jgi:hypothetical protein
MCHAQVDETANHLLVSCSTTRFTTKYGSPNLNNGNHNGGGMASCMPSKRPKQVGGNSMDDLERKEQVQFPGEAKNLHGLRLELQAYLTQWTRMAHMPDAEGTAGIIAPGLG